MGLNMGHENIAFLKTNIPQKGIGVSPKKHISSPDFEFGDCLKTDESADFEQLITYFMEDYRLAQKFERLYVKSKI